MWTSVWMCAWWPAIDLELYSQLAPTVSGIGSRSTATPTRIKQFIKVSESIQDGGFALFSKIVSINKEHYFGSRGTFPAWCLLVHSSRTFIALSLCVCGEAVISVSRKHSMAHWINDLTVGEGSSWIDLDSLIQEDRYERKRERERNTIHSVWAQLDSNRHPQGILLKSLTSVHLIIKTHPRAFQALIQF